ncbi:hypothetical protein CEXT_496021 [Caerostris extrusa]|uniref:Uncharacterized protein n=1 Tax=Caerostris extrusa TaxID=172846 RepID=A0AAV4V3P8_CAEEX|nr:hypothetical protein CEXT_496021 [Caerostris extrusa]
MEEKARIKNKCLCKEGRPMILWRRMKNRLLVSASERAPNQCPHKRRKLPQFYEAAAFETQDEILFQEGKHTGRWGDASLSEETRASRFKFNKIRSEIRFSRQMP